MAESAVSAPAAEQPAGTASMMFGLFRNPDYRYYWIANFFYFLAFGAQRFAFVLLVLELTDRAGLGGLAGFALGIPAFFITLPAGVWADRLDRRRMVMATNLAGLVVASAVAALFAFGVLTSMLALAMALAAGFVTAMVQPPLTAIVPMLVPRERLMNGIVLRTMGQNLAQIFGASLAGLAIAVVDFHGAFIAQAACYGLAFIAIALVRLPAMTPDASAEAPTRMATQAIEGLRFVFSNPALRGLVMISVISGLFMLGPVFVLMPEIARTLLEVGSTLNGMLLAFTGVGMLVMSLFLASRDSLGRKGLWFLVNMFLAGPYLIVMGLSPVYAVTALAMFLWGLGGGVFINLNQTLVQSHTPDHMMGRVMSIFMLSIIGFIPLGSLLAGAGAEVIGPDRYLAFSGGVLILASFWAWLTQRELRALD